jgi:hypothetical protein
MYIVVVIALLSTFMLINVMFSEHITAKVNLYSTDEMKKEDKQRAKIKLILIIIMALFWGATICYF